LTLVRPAIVFPCAYPIKVVGVNTLWFKEEVVALVRPHAPELADEHVTVRRSRAGTYCSVTITILATGETQLGNIHEALKRHPQVKLVL